MTCDGVTCRVSGSHTSEGQSTAAMPTINITVVINTRVYGHLKRRFHDQVSSEEDIAIGNQKNTFMHARSHTHMCVWPHCAGSQQAAPSVPEVLREATAGGDGGGA